MLFASTVIYAQITGTIESQKYKMGAGYSYYPGGVQISESELAIGSFVTDMEGNIKSSLPSYLKKDFGFSKAGIHVAYETQIVVTDAYSFVDYASMNSITALGKAKKVSINLTKSDTYLSTERCFETPYLNDIFISAENGLSDYGLLVWYNNLWVVEDDKMIKAIEIKAKGKRMDQLYTPQGLYYALYGDDSKLTLAKIDLKTGTDKYINLDKSSSYYMGGNIEAVGDNIIVGAFFGDCDNSGFGTAEGFMHATIKQADLTTMNIVTTPIPGEYEDKLDFCKNKLHLPEVLDIQTSGDKVYFLTNNFSGKFGPLAIWTYEDGKLNFGGNIETEGKAYIRSARMFEFNGKIFLLYTVDEGQYPQKVTETLKLAQLDKGEVSDLNLTIETASAVKAMFNLSHAYITPQGLILVPANNELDTCYLLKIQLS